MIESLTPYEHMKSSGTPGLGAIPAHWDAKRLKHVCRLQYGDSLSAGVRRDGHVPVMGSNGVVGIHNAANTRAPCLVIGRKGSFGKVNLCRTPVFAIDTTYFVDERSTLASIEFLAHSLSSLGLDSVSRDSAVPGLSREDAYSRVVVYPPHDEQADIVRFLDSTNLRINMTVGAKRKTIALLNEQKQAIIHQAVTRGLDPSLPLKPSGIAWVEELPAHWRVKRLGSLLKERGEVNRNLAVTDVLSLLRSRGVIPYAEKGNVGNKKSEDIGRYKIVRPNDIVMNSMNVIIGSVGISRYVGCLSPVYYVLERRDEGDSAEYFNALFQVESFHKSLVRIGKGILAHRMRIPMELLKAELFPYPEPAEQYEIMEFVDRATAAVSVAIEALEREVDLLTEYRIRLTSDVVTGKLDVREVAKSLPEIDEGVAESVAALTNELVDDEEMAGAQ